MGLGILAFVFGLALTTVLGDDACPSVSSKYAYQKTFQGICYTFFKTRLSFGNAADVCIHLNGTLALPKTKEINDFLAATMRDDLPFNRRAWIGLSDADKENDFVWADGTRLRYPDDFNAFGANEGPSSSLGQLQDYVALDPSGSWHDYRNIVQLGYTTVVIHMKSFICEFGTQTISTTQPAKQPVTTTPAAVITTSSPLPNSATTTPATGETRATVHL